MKSRLFEIEEVELHFANGHEARYERLGGSVGGVLVVPVTEDGMILLVRDYAVGVERYELGFVKGRVEIGESPEFAATLGMVRYGFSTAKKESMSPGWRQFVNTLLRRRVAHD